MAAPLDREVSGRLLAAAREVRERAHAPYSRFRVGAAVLDEQGRIHAGCNVENAAYPLGTCAEAAAIAAMVADAGRSVRALLVIADGPELVTPCGGCRQRLREFAAPDAPVLLAALDGVRMTLTMAELLPHSFGPEHLTK